MVLRFDCKGLVLGLVVVVLLVLGWWFGSGLVL